MSVTVCTVAVFLYQKVFFVLKQIVISISTVGLLAGCATQQLISTPTPAPIISQTHEPTSPTSKPAPAPSPTPSTPPPPPRSPYPTATSETEARQLLDKVIPQSVNQRGAWAQDMAQAFTALKLPYRADYFCATAAVIEQVSNWQAEPVVAGISQIVWREIEQRAGRYGVPLLAVQTALLIPSRDGRSYKARIDSLRTERELNALYEEMMERIPLVRDKLSMNNPIRTAGPMQVSIAFAQEHIRQKPYPYGRVDIRQETFTRRGGLYFGIAHLLEHPVSYSHMRYRFADFNAGHYSSRNAAFQLAVARLSGQPLQADGDLLRYQDGKALAQASQTQQRLYPLASRLGLSRQEIDHDLAQEKRHSFEQTRLYQRVFSLADQTSQGKMAREVVPYIHLNSPKISRRLTTEWFTERVEGRYQRCLQRVNSYKQ